MSVEFLNSKLIKSLPPIHQLEFLGIKSKIVLFRTEDCQLHLISLRNREEEDSWKAFYEMVKQGLDFAAASLRGFFGFDLIAFDFNTGIKHFDLQGFSQLLLNHGRKMETGESRWIKYGEIYGIFKKRISEDWGKIDFQYHIETFLDETEKLDLKLKKLLKACENNNSSECPSWLVIHDLSRLPIYQPNHPEQSARLIKLVHQLKIEKSAPSKIFIMNNLHVAELMNLS